MTMTAINSCWMNCVEKHFFTLKRCYYNNNHNFHYSIHKKCCVCVCGVTEKFMSHLVMFMAYRNLKNIVEVIKFSYFSFFTPLNLHIIFMTSFYHFLCVSLFSLRLKDEHLQVLETFLSRYGNIFLWVIKELKEILIDDFFLSYKNSSFLFYYFLTAVCIQLFKIG
jgi:hypothetical protein